MPQAAVQEAVQQNEKELLRTAAYARLSVENGGHETEDSLHTQILQIHNYIRENPELTLTDTYGEMVFYCGYKRSAGKFSKCYGGYYREYSVNAKVARAIKTVFYALDVVNQGMQKKQSITVRCVDIEDLEKQAEAIRVEQIKLYESYAEAEGFHPCRQVVFAEIGIEYLTMQELGTRAARSKLFIGLAHVAAARCGKGDDCFTLQIIAFQKCIDDRRSNIPPDRESDKDGVVFVHVITLPCNKRH